ncbi:MAG: Menaquinone via 6-amino-6-deoxyfutalosine step 1 [uncultured Sulfurovum sp.]|uniref:Menaquinone via 6-amino-6-deoxyfutalosine step 1 n=1 Tax=uncultured Sulfurovum sp. TaxID=269237 RepID=A0A6S6TQH9_9BACT|nr:MAG: Menaquinone via 6-amino-6-deoxyfutalosine step 1 [uncultured Sulfurovum sp.]
MKRYVQHSGMKMGMNYRKNVPSQINKALKKRQIDAGFISSIASPKYKSTDLGIIANKAVYSVFLIEGEPQADKESETSNALAQVLKLQGKVLIGDKALKYYLNGGEGIDLATAWYEQTKLPFVFGTLCYTSHETVIKKIVKNFKRKPIKIPQYILKREAKKRAISSTQLTSYLKHIEYNMNHKSKKSLKLFLKKVKQHKV